MPQQDKLRYWTAAIKAIQTFLVMCKEIWILTQGDRQGYGIANS